MSSLGKLRTSPPAGNVNPLGETAAVLALDLLNVGIAAAAAANTVLPGRVKLLPVAVLLDALALVKRRHLEVGLVRQLEPRGVGGAVLDGGVAVAKVAEVVDVARREEGAGREGVDRGVSPLLFRLASWDVDVVQDKHTRSIQKPPLRSIIWKNSSYSLLRKKSRRAISKLDQKWHML
jgi:hypothetical protein